VNDEDEVQMIIWADEVISARARWLMKQGYSASDAYNKAEWEYENDQPSM
jgi:hypothetical protein